MHKHTHLYINIHIVYTYICICTSTCIRHRTSLICICMFVCVCATRRLPDMSQCILREMHKLNRAKCMFCCINIGVCFDSVVYYAHFHIVACAGVGVCVYACVTKCMFAHFRHSLLVSWHANFAFTPP